MPPMLAAEWTTLALANFAVDAAVLAPHVPPGTELDTHEGVAYASLVGFMWANPRLWGLPAPFHGRFAEVNLRTYVRRGAQRGVVFLKELVGMPLVAWVARDVYHENFALVRVEAEIEVPAPGAAVTYRWCDRGRWEALRLQLDARPPHPAAAFFLERDHAFTRTRDSRTLAYPVERASGRVWHAAHVALEADMAALYGPDLAPALAGPCASAFLAEGSAVRVGWGRELDSRTFRP